MKLLSKTCYFNRFGSRKSRIEFEGDYTKEDLENLVEDAPFGYWIGTPVCVDPEKKLYKGEIHEYWD